MGNYKLIRIKENTLSKVKDIKGKKAIPTYPKTIEFLVSEYESYLELKNKMLIDSMK